MGGPGMTPILYVTGEETHASAVAAGLRSEPAYRVITAATATEARRCLSERSDIQCLLCADALPDTDAFDFIESLQREYPDLPVVCYPASGSEEIASKAISAKVTEYLPHSEDPDHVPELAETIRDAIDSSWATVTLRERIKELRGIRQITHLLEDSLSRPLTEVLRDIVKSLPASFQHPAIAEARLTVGETSVATEAFIETEWMLTVDTVTVNGREIALEVSYLEERPNADDGPFLSEERSFCMTVATLVKGGVERRAYVEEVSKREQLFRELAENLTEVLWVSDPASEEVMYVNPEYESVWGRSRQSLYDDPSSFLDAVHPDDRSRVEKSLREKADGRYETEYRIVQPDGAVRWIHDRGILVIDEDAEPYRFVGIAEDITERKARGQQLAVLNRVLRHNLRNDLTVIAGYAELIAAEADNELLEYAEIIKAKTGRLTKLADKQRQMTTQLESLPQQDTVDLSMILRDIKESVSSTFPDAEITTSFETELDVSTTPQLKLALHELITNAVEHTDVDPPAVEVSVQTKSDAIVIEVADTGPGIPEMEIEVLGNEEEPLFHGRGLGLWIAYWIVTRAGGTLEFSENTPRGSIVAIRLPRPRVNNPDLKGRDIRLDR